MKSNSIAALVALGRALSDRAPLALSIFAVCGPVYVSAARADLVISSADTRNMHCGASLCRATAGDAVLNVNQLENMLAGAKVTVATAEPAGPNIVVSAPLSWASTNSLTLDAYTSVTVSAPIADAGAGGFSIITNDGGSGGKLLVADGGNVTFWSASNKLSINRIGYKLFNSIETLATAIKAKPAGFFALANSYDASMDGTYNAAPVAFLQGTLEGLGNTISNLSIKAPEGNEVGLIAQTDLSALVENLGLTGVNIVAKKPASAGGLVGLNFGTLFNDSVSGRIVAPGNSAAGLVAGQAYAGTVANSHSSGTVRGRIGGGLLGGAFDVGYAAVYVLNSSSTASVASPKDQDYAPVGGLVGYADDNTLIENSWSSGKVTGGSYATAGGLAGQSNCGVIVGSFATGAVSGGDNASTGGLVGNSGCVGGPDGEIAASYATGVVRGGASSYDGGLVGSCTTPLLNDFATGDVTGGQGAWVGGLVGWALCGGMDQVSASGHVSGGSLTGGLVGFNYNSISNAFATGAVTGSANGSVGGLIGQSIQPVSDSYSAGAVSGNGAQYVGGLLGEDQTQYQYLSDTYWDLTTSGISDPAQGAGNVSNDPGVAGETDEQLKAQLPQGFSSKIWGQSPQINGGLPYLLANNFATARHGIRFQCPAGLPAKFAALCRSGAKR